MQNKTFRLFVSSTFSDFNEERKLLQTIVFPEIKKYCRDNGLNFQPIDLRWGVTEEASNDQKTLSLCLEEVQSSKYHPYPNFLIMAGDRYGWVPLPYAIEQNEYETVLQNIDNLSDKELLNTWYKLDENQIPASYILNERKKSDSSHDRVDYTNKDNWRKIENQLKTILQTSVKNSNLNEKQKRKYFTSATEAEVIEGIFKYLDKTEFQNKLLEKDATLEKKDYESVYAYIRNIKSISNLKDKFIDMDLIQVKVDDFKKEIKKSINSSNILESDVNLINVFQDEKNGSLNYEYETILDNENSLFVKKMVEYFKSSIDKHIEISKDISIEELEKYEQERFKKSKLKDFLEGSKKEALTAIDNYNNNQALVIYGKSGLGKSSLMAKAIQNTEDKYKTSKKIIYRFIGSTANLSNTPTLLISILKELNIQEEIKTILNPQTRQNEPEKIEDFYYRCYSHLSLITEETVIFIDAIDQINNEDEFLWLPNILPNNVKIIISALKDVKYKDDSKYFETLKIKTENLYSLELFENPKELINSLLSKYDRKITKKQMEDLLSKEDSNSPLYLSIAAQELRHWKSNDEIKTLASTQKGIIEEFILNLSKLYHHDKEFVKRVFSYTYLTNGVSETELLELVTIDEEFINYLAPDTFHTNITKELPVVIWARLYSQIKEFIKYELVNNQETMSFFHREFLVTISQVKDIKSVHEKLVILLQKLIVKYQYEPIKSNRWSDLYIEVVKKYHLKYEFNYLLDNNSKLKFWCVEYFDNLKDNQYIEDKVCITGLFDRTKLFGDLNTKLQIEKTFGILTNLGYASCKNNNVIEANFYYKTLYYISNILYKKNSSIWVAEYTKSLNNFAFCLKLIEKTDEAMDFEKEALNISKKLYKENPSRWAEDYTMSLNNLSNSLNLVGKIDEAIDLGKEALNIVRDLYNDNSSKWVELYLKILHSFGRFLYSKEKIDKAMDFQREALTITKELYTENPSRWAEDHTLSLNNFAISLNAIEKKYEAIDFRREALQITKELYIKNPSQSVEYYLASVNNFAISLNEIGKINEAIDFQREALKITKELYIDNPSRWVANYMICSINLASCFKSIKNITEAIELEEEILDICEELYKENPSRWAKDYMIILKNLAISLESIGNIIRAIALKAKASEINKELYKENQSIWTEVDLNSTEEDLEEEALKKSVKIEKELYLLNKELHLKKYTYSLLNLIIYLKRNKKSEEIKTLISSIDDDMIKLSLKIRINRTKILIFI